MKLKLVPIDKNASVHFLQDTITTGFQSPAEDYKEAPINIDNIVVKNKTATFFGTVEGFALQEEGIYNGSHLVIDKSVQVSGTQLVVAVINGEFCIKKVAKVNNNYYQMPGNIRITEEIDFSIWGVITWVFSPAACLLS